jgi:hypothetical protein
VLPGIRGQEPGVEGPALDADSLRERIAGEIESPHGLAEQRLLVGHGGGSIYAMRALWAISWQHGNMRNAYC